MLVCIYEDRLSAEPGLRLLVASLLAHNPGLPVHLHYPDANEPFSCWLERYPSVVLDTRTVFRERGWNVKPDVLLRALDRGEPDVVWIDSDIIVNRDLRPVFADLGDDTLVVAEEALWGAPDDGEAERARLWNFTIGRTLPFTLNSCVVRVTANHRRLLEEWARCLRSDRYVAAQAGPYAARPKHLVGDQDVLTALLCRDDFADVPLRILRRGTHILQVFGLKAYSLRERATTLRHGLPAFVHAQGEKPWADASGGPLARAFADTSPYKALARRYRDSLAPHDWLRPRSTLGRALLLMGGGQPPLAGLPISAAVDLASFVRRRLRRASSAAPDPAQPNRG